MHKDVEDGKKSSLCTLQDIDVNRETDCSIKGRCFKRVDDRGSLEKANKHERVQETEEGKGVGLQLLL